MYVGNDGGIYKTTNAHAAVAMTIPSSGNCDRSGVEINWTPLNHDYGVTQFYHGTASPVDGNSYFGGTQDNGTVGGKDDQGSNDWRLLTCCDAGYVAITPSGDTRYAEIQRGELYKSTGAGDFTSTGNLYQIIECDSYAGCGDPNAHQMKLPFISVYILDPNDSQRLWFGGNFMWRSTDAAATWTQVGHRLDDSVHPNTGVLDDSASVTAIAVAPGNLNRVFVGTRAGDIIHSENANARRHRVEQDQ